MEVSAQFHAPTHWIGDCVDPRAGLDAVAKKIVFISLKKTY